MPWPTPSIPFAVTLLAIALAFAVAPVHAFPDAPVAAPGVTVTVHASGLHDPRGLARGAGRELYVAEAGTTEGVFVPPPPPPPLEPPTRTRCEVYWPVGPKTPGHTGRIVHIPAPGVVRVVAAGLPSTASNGLIGGDRLGVADVVLRGRRLYALVNGGGCTAGHPSEPNGLYRIFADGAAQPIADLSGFLRSQVDSKDPAAGDFEPDGVWYAMQRAFGAFHALEPNHGVLVRIDDDGAITRVADLIAAVAALEGDGDLTFSAFTVHRGAFYVATLGRIDTDFAASAYRVARDGEFFISNCGYHCDDVSRPGLPSLRVGQVLRVTLRDAQAHADEDDE